MEILKKIGLIVLFLAVIGGVGFGIYTFFFESSPVEVTPPDEVAPPTQPTDGLPTAGEFLPGEDLPASGGEPLTGGDVFEVSPPSAVASGGLTQVDTIELVSPLAIVPSPSGLLSFYDQNDGRFYALDQNGNPQLLSNKRFFGAEDITWSPETDKAIIEFPDETKIIFDFETDKQITLPNHWEDFSFSNDGEMFAAKTLGRDPENQWLITVDSDGSNAKLVEHLGDNADKVIVSVSPNSSVVAISDTGDAVGFDTKEILLIGQNNENFKAMRIEGFNFEPLWSPSGDHMLYSTSSAENGYRPVLWFVAANGDTIGEGRTNLSLNTWVHKCTFADSVTIFCAVPDELPEGIGLQPDLIQTASDTIFRIDLQLGKTTLVGKPDGNLVIDSLVISKDQSTLFMQSTGTETLNKMRLK